MSAETSHSEKILSRADLVMLAVGNVIGGGIMAVTGIAIGMTGRSAVWAFLFACVLVLFEAIPQFFAGGTIRMNGGFYTQAAMFGGKYFAGLYAVIFVSFFFGASMYALSFADYVLDFFPNVDGRLIAFACLTVFYLINLFGVQIAAKVQYVLVVVLILALSTFIAFGIPEIKPGFFTGSDFFHGGFNGFMSATALLSMAPSGAVFIVNFGKQCKRPTRDIPFAIIVGTIVVSVLYTGMAFVAAGVLPVEDVAGKSLGLVAAEIFPRPVFIFFMVGGAMVALVTSLNALFGWITPPLAQACEDGWFPRFLGAQNKRFKTNHWIMTIIYLLTASIIIFGWDMTTIANVGNFLASAATVVISLCLLTLPKKIPEIWGRSAFHVPEKVFKEGCIVSALVDIMFCYFLAIELTKADIIGLFIYLGVALLYPYLVLKYSKQGVEIEVSYEEV